jgi:nucleoside-diphosphate-sugar epimerase
MARRVKGVQRSEMPSRKIRLTPNESRLLYDLVASTGASVVAFVFSWSFLGVPLPLLFLGPFLVVAFNRVVGIYTTLKIGAGSTKAIRLTASLVASAAVLFAFSRSLPGILLWFVLLWAPLVLPRLLLNLNTRVKTNFVSGVIRQRGPVLVVGGAGYIGTHLVDELLKSNAQVRIFDRLLYGRGPIEKLLANPNVELVEGDVTDLVKLLEAMRGVSAVVHLAGLVGDPACALDEAFTRHTNVIATRMVKEAALSFGVPRFIFASSCSVYGTTDHEVSEADDLNPVSLYARTKIDSERELLLCPNEDFSVTVLRFATVFGHSRRPRFDLVANLFTAQAMIDGKITLTGEKQWRPFVHVRDLARAIVMVLNSDPEAMRGRVFNVGDKRLNLTIGQLAEKVQRVVSKIHAVEIIRQPDVADLRNYSVSFDRIRGALGFECATSIEDGISEIVNEFQIGTYGDWRSSAYSNVAVTREALLEFLDPQQSARLYAPLADARALADRLGTDLDPAPQTSTTSGA